MLEGLPSSIWDPSWGLLGPILGLFGAHLGPSWVHLGLIFDPSGAMLGLWEVILGHRGCILWPSSVSCHADAHDDADADADDAHAGADDAM